MIDDQGQAVTRATIRVQGSETLVDDSGGRFHLMDVPDRPYVVVQAEGCLRLYWSGLSAADLPETLVLKRGVRWSARLVDASGLGTQSRLYITRTQESPSVPGNPFGEPSVEVEVAESTEDGDIGGLLLAGQWSVFVKPESAGGPAARALGEPPMGSNNHPVQYSHGAWAPDWKWVGTFTLAAGEQLSLGTITVPR
ncbi:MAG: hypothetical protein R3F33_17930 [Planctomycetota bacterium]